MNFINNYKNYVNSLINGFKNRLLNFLMKYNDIIRF